jgi:ribosomal protein S18 acetylase RimI-like enzyme
MSSAKTEFTEVLSVTDASLSFRDISDEDLEVLLKIYSSTREKELSVTNWSEEQKSVFLKSQFDAQHFHYQKYYHDTYFWLMLYDEKIAGRLYLQITHEIRIVDITLLPDFRNKKIGGGLLKDIQNLAKNRNMNVSIHVEQFNPALHLYKRLGFEVAETVNSIYYLMNWKPE